MRVDPGPELKFGTDWHGLVDWQFAVVAQVRQSGRRFLIQCHFVLKSPGRFFHDSRHSGTVWAVGKRNKPIKSHYIIHWTVCTPRVLYTQQFKLFKNNRLLI